MAAMECREVLCPGILPVDIKWGFHEFGYPLTLQNFNKSPKLESLDSLTVPYQAAWSKADWSLPSHHQSQLWSPAPCTSRSILGWDIHSWMLAQGRNMHGTSVFRMPWDRTKGQTKLGLSLLNMFPRIHQATCRAQNWKTSWLGWMCVLWGQMQFILAEHQQIAKLSWMRKALRVKL